jgi:putative Mn2+ efflux pump MntP
MSEISRFTWWFFGLFIIVVSVMINWQKFFLFILVGLVFLVAGFVKHKKVSRKNKLKKKRIRKEKEIKRLKELERERERIQKRLELYRGRNNFNK